MSTTTKIASFALVLAGWTATSAWPAVAQVGNCAPREELVGKLQQSFQEKTVNLGVTAKGELLEVVAAPSGTWTILISLPGGPTCVVSHGEGWRALKPGPEQRISEIPAVESRDLYADVSYER